MNSTQITRNRTSELVYNPEVLNGAITAWAMQSTDTTTARRADLLRDKARAVSDFFDFAQLHPATATAMHVQLWLGDLETRGLSQATIYAMASRLSAFYKWAMDDAQLSQIITYNPVETVRPKAPKAYQTEATQALELDDVKRLIAVVKAESDKSVTGKRDYAMLLFYLFTGKRRAEIARLTWGNVKINGTVKVTYKVKGGEFVTKPVNHPAVKGALLDYLEATGRLETMQADDPLWFAHDRSGQNAGALSSHGFVKNLKKYAALAGIDHIHLHQTRHTFANILVEQGESLGTVQDELGHKNQQTTRIYTGRIATRPDKSSSVIGDALGID